MRHSGMKCLSVWIVVGVGCALPVPTPYRTVDAAVMGDDVVDIDTVTDADPMRFGLCGEKAANEFCDCDAGVGCWLEASQQNDLCMRCLRNTLDGCCILQSNALRTCETSGGCTNISCTRGMCAMELGALQVCVATMLRSDGMCRNELTGCFGQAVSAPEIVCKAP
jgi:hypothetical protein